MSTIASGLFLSPKLFAAPPGAPRSTSALRDYVEAPDASYGWRVRREEPLGSGTLAELIVTSQTWRDTLWKHQLFLYRPAQVQDDAAALLLIGGGRWSDAFEKPPGERQLPEEVERLVMLAEMIQAPVAVLLHVPQQPLFDGMVEDEIISFTFENFLRTGDPTWPLLLPMVKSAVRGMDAASEFAKDQWQLDIDQFLVCGASKRGWTTWLTGAVDPRVSAIAPMVINMLNMAEHMKLQRASYGTQMSDELHDYTERGLQQHIASERGSALRAIVDPYSYRQELVQPKLVILGTNDRYWPVDALNLYWDQLKGPKHVLYVPNNGHGLRDYARVVGTVAALHASLNGGAPLPELDWEFVDEPDGVRIKLSSDKRPAVVRVWTATSDSRDFREAKWEAREARQGESGAYAIDVARPEDGFAAVFAEAQFNGRSLPFYLSTDLRVVPSDAPGGE